MSRTEKLQFITDASYLGLGALLTLDNTNLSDMLFEAPFSSHDFPLHSKESKYRNHCEFLGLVVGILMLLK